MNWKFLIKKTSQEVQNVGLRPFIVSMMIEQGFQKGNAINLESGTEVEILLEGEKEKVEKFRNKLANSIKKEAENKYSELPKEFEVTELEEKHGNNNALIGLNSKASSLGLSQTSKGVAVMVQGFGGLSKQTRDGFGGLSKQTKEGFEGLSNKMENGFNGLGSGIKEIGQEIKQLGQKIDKGFEKLPKEITENLGQKIDQMSNKLDTLPKAIAKAIKESNAI